MRITSFFTIMKYSWLDHKKNFFWFIQISVSPFFFAITALYMFSDLENHTYITNVLLGSAVMGLWVATLLGTGNEIKKDRRLGTIEMLMITPTSLQTIIFSRACLHTLLGFCAFLEIFIISLLITKGQVIIYNIPQIIFVLLITIISFSFLGMIGSAVFVLKREASALSNIFSRLVYVISGTMFPIFLLPRPLRYLGYTLSPTWSISLLRDLALNNISQYKMLSHTIIIIVITIIYYLIIVKLYKVIEEQILKTGDIRRV